MSGNDEDSFYLYGMGERPEALTLGSLVLEKYWQPLVARHYTHEPLSAEELEKHAWSYNLKNCVFHGKTRLSPGIGVDGVDLVNLNLAFRKDHERFLTARTGTKLVLKEPEQFLRTHVLSNTRAQAALKLWLSAARSKYVLNFKWARRPKIWLLTGLYLLEGARSIVRKGNSSNVSVGIDSLTMSALAYTPIGGSISLGYGSSLEIQMEMDERYVWAAQYRLVDAKYIQVGPGEEPSLPTSMVLYKDVLSVNLTRDAFKDGVEIALESTKEPTESANEEEEKGEDESEEAYEKRLEEAIKIFEETPPRLLA